MFMTMMASPTRNSSRSHFSSPSRASTRSFLTSSSRREISLEYSRSRRGTAFSHASRRSLFSQQTEESSKIEEHIIPEELEALYSRCETLEQSVQQNVKKVQQTHAAVKADVKKFRKQIDDVLDAWENEVMTEIDDILTADLSSLQTVLEESRKMLEEMQTLSKGVSDYQVKLFEVSAIEMETRNTYREYKFVGHEVLVNVFKTETKLGDVKITQDVAGLYNSNIETYVPTFVEEIKIKTDDDVFDCDVTGMAAIGAHRVVVADSDNKAIKCIDTINKTISSQIYLESAPWDLTMFHRGQVAVTIPSDRLIQFVSTTNYILREGRILRVSGECRGIAYLRECLIVSFRNPGKVQIITLTGRVLKNIKLNCHKSRIFDWPDYIAVNRFNGSIFVSDWRRNTVTRLNWKGEVTASYKDRKGTNIGGLAIAEDGGVYVSKRASHSIMKLSPDLEFVKIILEEKHGLRYPWCVCFDDEDGILYVDSNRGSNSVSVFELI